MKTCFSFQITAKQIQVTKREIPAARKDFATLTAVLTVGSIVQRAGRS